MTAHTTQAPCGCSIASLNDGDVWFNELQPCALHGAAEELLAACRATVAALEEHHYVNIYGLPAMRAAIAKAEEL